MVANQTAIVAVFVGMLVMGGCAASQTSTSKLLPAPSGSHAIAARHNDEGIQAYVQRQYDMAKQHFEAAITASPDLAEAHYNLGMALYKLGALREGDTHFVKAANLAPGNKVIWDSPPLRSVSVPEKEVTPPGSSDGHMHSH